MRYTGGALRSVSMYKYKKPSSNEPNTEAALLNLGQNALPILIG